MFFSALEQHKAAFQSLSPDVVVDMIAYTEADIEPVLHTFRGNTKRAFTASAIIHSINLLILIMF